MEQYLSKRGEDDLILKYAGFPLGVIDGGCALIPDPMCGVYPLSNKHRLALWKQKREYIVRKAAT